SRGLFYAFATARSLKTQQRAFTSRPRLSFGWGEAKTPRRVLRDMTFERKLEVKVWPACRPTFFTESLILAQDERWRRAYHMQVEREPALRGWGQRRTGE